LIDVSWSGPQNATYVGVNLFPIALIWVLARHFGPKNVPNPVLAVELARATEIEPAI
jgi:hypothetical protein